MMPYAANGEGRPVFFTSSMAMHTQNLVEDPRSSLLVTQPDVAGDPLGGSRVTILGASTLVTANEVRDLYLSRHENAKFWQDYSDFAFYRLEVSAVYFIGGFGVMGWISAKDYEQARPDPLAEAARGIIQHMNSDHADALRLLAQRFAGENADEASMTAIDRLGFQLQLTSGDGISTRRVAFLRELKQPADARAMFIEMIGLARSPSPENQSTGQALGKPAQS